MKKNITQILALTGVIFLIGCGQQPISQNQLKNKDSVAQEMVNNKKLKDNKSYSYCKPDEDSDFKLTKKDELYYYYEGEKMISGGLYQQNPASPITFDTHIDQACKFELTKNYVSNIGIIKKDFDIDNAWRNQPNCDTLEGDAYLEGVYSINVKGFKISKSYIQQYDPSRMIDKLHMNRYSFYINYDKIEKVDEKSQVKCQQVLYEPIVDPGPDSRF